MNTNFGYTLAILYPVTDKFKGGMLLCTLGHILEVCLKIDI